MSFEIKDNSNFNLEEFKLIMSQLGPKYHNLIKNLPFQKEGIFFSDGLLICALCEMYQVDILIESGRGFGGSTEMFAMFFEKHRPDLKIYSVDLAQEGNPEKYVWSKEKNASEFCQQRLQKFKNLTLIDGDSFIEIPKILNQYDLSQTKVGVFIDGPKAELQLKLADQLFQLSPNIFFCALDDVGLYFDNARFGFRRTNFYNWKYSVFDTSMKWFYKTYNHINKGNHDLPGKRLWAITSRKTPAGTGVGVSVNF